MSVHFKAKQFKDEADEMTKKLFDEKGNLRPEALEEPVQAEPAATPEPEVVEESEAEAKLPEAKPDPKVVEEDKYKAAVKAMNEAQREAAELKKAQKDQEAKQLDLEKRLQELVEDQKKRATQVHEPVDDLESELPDVATISERKANKVKSELDPRLSSVERELAEYKAQLKKDADTQHALILRQDVIKAHPDFDEVVNSEAMQSWINNEAPPIFKAIYDGSVNGSARDIVEVVNRFKSTLAAPKVTSDTPSDKVATVKNPVNPTTKPERLAPLTQTEIKEFQNRGHNWPKEKREEFNARLEGMFKS